MDKVHQYSVSTVLDQFPIRPLQGCQIGKPGLDYAVQKKWCGVELGQLPQLVFKLVVGQCSGRVEQILPGLLPARISGPCHSLLVLAE